MNSKLKELAASIDHTNLRLTARRDEIITLCEEAKHYEFYAVCVQPCYVKLCSDILGKKSQVKVCTVIGFPHGYSTTRTKVAETKHAIEDGADEVDMVINICKIKDDDWRYVENDIRKVVQAASKRVVKVILETDQLKEFEIRRACEVVANAGAHFVKTSTGFNGRASVAHVKLMEKSAPMEVEIKASGGIKTLSDAKKYLNLGCTRLGVSSSVKIMVDAGAPYMPGREPPPEPPKPKKSKIKMPSPKKKVAKKPAPRVPTMKREEIDPIMSLDEQNIPELNELYLELHALIKTLEKDDVKKKQGKLLMKRIRLELEERALENQLDETDV